MKRIFIIGQCTLHWGRIEFGNIGNYYIVEPFMRELHRVFPNAEIRTTMQMTAEFCEREKVSTVPMELYYGWKRSDLWITLYELFASCVKKWLSISLPKTLYMLEVEKSDLVIDFSGDIWGDNANFLGKNRFFVGTTKDLIAKLLGKPVVMLAGSPGPFNNGLMKKYARYVYSKFDIVTNREPVVEEILRQDNFDLSKSKTLACPAFLFQPYPESRMIEHFKKEGLLDSKKPKIGFIICGWNMKQGPFDRWPRTDEEYIDFAKAIEVMANKFDATIYLMSHANGFILPPNFKMIHGRDFPMAKQLFELVKSRGITSNVKLIDTIYNTWETKSIIGKFDMLVSGRIHAAVAALSQNVPTVIIDYGHEPKAHKLKGFASVAQVSEYVADPENYGELISKIELCWENRIKLREHLAHRIPEVQTLARENFNILKNLHLINEK